MTRVPFITNADVPPLGPVAGDLWWSTTNGQLFVYYNDGTTQQWVVANQDGAVTGPPGPQGPIGLQGPVGPIGPAGAGALSVVTYGVTMDGTTDDTANVIAAVSAAAASGNRLYWPPGTALTTASIPLLHSVKHTGPGDIKRGTDLFAVEPLDADTNHLYVAPAGVATNDGLSAAQPTTPQGAANAWLNYGPVLGGTWEMNFAAGSHSAVLLASSLIGNIRLVGVPTGDYRSVPTSVIDKTLSPSSRNGVYGSGAGKNLFVKDLKAINFSADGDSGFRAQQHIYAVYENCHTYNCYFGLTHYNFVLYSVAGGILDGGASGYYGINELFCCVRNFRAGITINNRTTVKNYTFGSHSKELCTGHMDFLQVMDCTWGVMFTRASTANAADMDFRRNTYAAVVESASGFVKASDINWHGHRITAASWAAGVVSYTFALDTYGRGIDVAVGDRFDISACAQAGYNGSFVALSASATSATAALVADPGAWVSGGRIDVNTHHIIPTGQTIIQNIDGEGGNVEGEVLPPYVGMVSKVRDTATVPVALTGTTAVTAIFYPLTGFKPGEFQTIGYEVTVSAAGTYNLTVAGATLLFRIGNSNIHYYVLPIGAKNWVMEARFIITATGNFQHHSGTLAVDGEPVQVKRGAATFATSTTEYNYGVWGQLTTAADTITGEVAILKTTMM